MARFKVRPLAWCEELGDFAPCGLAVVVEADTKQGAEAAAFAIRGFPEGAVRTAPIGEAAGDTLPCGCRQSGLTRVRKGITYVVDRTPRKVRGLWRCEGCL